MNALIAVILGAATVYLTYTRYARRIDRNVIQSDPKRATPATLSMDGVDFMPTNKNILFGYHFKSIAAAGPIVGAIAAATLWGWLPAMIWLIGVYLFDTAPTANARRLLGMSKVYSLWVDKMLKSREEARTLREMLSFSKKKESDPLMSYLLQFRERMAQARQRLTDSERTAFFFVTLPEALPIAVISRFIGWFQDFGIPVGGIIVNMLLDKASLGQDSPEFVLNRVRMQEEYMKTIWEKFDGAVRALVSLFDQKVRGIQMLQEAARKLMG